MGEFLLQAEDSGGKFNPSTEIPEKDKMEELRIVLLGKTGVGKSAVGNAILGEKVFPEECSLNSAKHKCQREEKVINDRRIVVIDTPGIFDTDRSEEELRDEIVSCLVECSPGPHVFIVVLKIERHTKENQKALQQLLEYFTDSIFPHMIILFTHGEDLDENIRVSDLIKQSGIYTLKDVAEKCGNRIHVIDNKHWDRESRNSAALVALEGLNLSEQALKSIKDKMTLQLVNKTPWFNELSDQADNVKTELQSETEEKRNNDIQLSRLMKSVKNILRDNNGHYTNETLEEIGKAINEEVEKILKEPGTDRETEMEIWRRARKTVRDKLKLVGATVGTLLGALLGVGVGVAAPFVLVAGLIRKVVRKATDQRPQAGGPPVQKKDVRAGAAAGAAAVAGGISEAGALAAGAATGIGAGVGAGVLLLYGAAKGGDTGSEVSKTVGSRKKAADKAAEAVTQKAGDMLKACWYLGDTGTGTEYEPLNNND